MKSRETRSGMEQLRQDHIGRLFMRSSRIFEQLALARLNDAGFDDLRMVHLSFVRNLEAEGSKLIDIAERSNMTKQAAGLLAKELEKRGYIVKKPSKDDGRAVLVQFTGRGLDLLSSLGGVLADTEKEMAKSVGTKTFQQIKLGLNLLVSHHE